MILDARNLSSQPAATSERPSTADAVPTPETLPLTTRAKYEQPAPNYSGSQVGTSITGGSYQGPHYYIDYSRKTAGPIKKDDDDSATQNIAATESGSFYSYHSARDISTFVREIGGRMFNNQSEVYMLPSDDDEFQRLAKQHYAFVLAMNGLYPAAEIVEEILDPANTSRQPAILDLGCGSGIWATEMAQKFPHASVVAIDLAPAPVDLESVPENLRYEIDDINLGLSHYHNHFDVISVRCIGSGIDSFADMMADAEACLRPGGIIIFMDGDMQLYKDDCVSPIPVGVSEDEGGDPTAGSWMARLARETRWAGAYNGADIDGLEDEIDKGLWHHPLIDPSTVRAASLFAPLGPWASATDQQEDQKLRYAGSLVRQDFIRLGYAWHALMAKAGIPQRTLDEWSARADDELNNNKFRMSYRWRLTWGRRLPEGASEASAPSTPTFEEGRQDPTLSTSGHAANYRDYRSFIVYSSQKDALQAMHQRKEAAKNLPTPLVTKLRETRRNEEA